MVERFRRRGGTPPALGDLLVAPARKWPDRTAIDDGTDSHTFAELERGALALASRLAGLGVGPGDRVVVLAAKRAVMPMIIMAVWKRGAVYVPLDAAEPAPRLHSLLTRLAPAAVLALDDREPALAAPWLGKEQLDEALAGADAAHTTVAHRPEDPAYLVFASGATGEPQGAEIGVAALLAHFGGHNEVLRLTAESRVLSLSPFHFDVSLLDTVLPLSVGAFVHQFRSLPAGAVIRSVLARQRLTHLLAVTVMLTQITGDGRQITPAKLPSLELVMTGAQVCEPAVLRPWLQNLPQVRLVQAFGPPEATIFSLTHELGPSDADRTTACPVGRPCAAPGPGSCGTAPNSANPARWASCGSAARRSCGATSTSPGRPRVPSSRPTARAGSGPVTSAPATRTAPSCCTGTPRRSPGWPGAGPTSPRSAAPPWSAPAPRARPWP